MHIESWTESLIAGATRIIPRIAPHMGGSQRQ